MVRLTRVLLLLPLLAGCPAKKAPGPDPVLLGEVGALTGAEASFGLFTRDGIALAVEEVNADGGIAGRPVQVRVYDSQSRPEEAAAAAQRLVSGDHVVAVLGEAASSNSLAMAPIAQAAQVPMISPSSTNPRVTQVGDFIFRACFLDDAQGAAMARYARATASFERVALFTEVSSAYSRGLSEVFAARFSALGGQVVDRQSYSRGDTDFRAQLTALKRTAPQAVYLPGYYEDAAAIAEQARELGLKVVWLGADGWSAQKLLELSNGALEGAVFTDSYAADDPSPASSAFITRFTARFGKPPNGNAALGYDAAWLVLDALRRNPGARGAALRDLIAGARLEGATGLVTFDGQRNPIKPVVLVGVEQGAFRYRATVAATE
jgi:branched-chain amino acid transport system substrate-binding protein